MRPNAIHYPRWFLWLRGFVAGVIAGAAVMTLAHRANAVPDWGWMLIPSMFSVPLLVLGPFEIYFAVRRYRQLRRQMVARTTVAQST